MNSRRPICKLSRFKAFLTKGRERLSSMRYKLGDWNQEVRLIAIAGAPKRILRSGGFILYYRRIKMHIPCIILDTQIYLHITFDVLALRYLTFTEVQRG